MSPIIIRSMCCAAILSVPACDQAPPPTPASAPVTMPVGGPDDRSAQPIDTPKASDPANDGVALAPPAAVAPAGAQQGAAVAPAGAQQGAAVAPADAQQGAAVAPAGAQHGAPPRDGLLAPAAFGTTNDAPPLDANEVNDVYAVPGDPISDMDEPRGNSISEMGGNTRSISSMSDSATPPAGAKPNAQTGAQPPAAAPVP